MYIGNRRKHPKELTKSVESVIRVHTKSITFVDILRFLLRTLNSSNRFLVGCVRYFSHATPIIVFWHSGNCERALLSASFTVRNFRSDEYLNSINLSCPLVFILLYFLAIYDDRFNDYQSPSSNATEMPQYVGFVLSLKSWVLSVLEKKYILLKFCLLFLAETDC